MAGYNPNSSMGNDNGSLLHALFQNAPKRPDQQAPIGPQGAGPSLQAGLGYNQSLLHGFQSMNDPRSSSSSRVASPSSRQQPGVFRPHSGTPPGQMPQANIPKEDQKNNLLYLLTQRPQQEQSAGGAANQGTFGNDHAQFEQRSASMGGSDNHKTNASLSRSYSQQKTASHATPDSLLALLNQPNPAAQQAQPPYENGARAQQDNAKPDFATNGSNSLAELLGIKPQQLPKREGQSVDKSVEKSADELTDELANMLSSEPVKESIDHCAKGPVKSAAHSVKNDAEQKIDTASARATSEDNAAVDTPEIASVIDGVDNLSVDTAKPAIGNGPEKAVPSDETRVDSGADAIADDWETALDTAGDAREGQDNTKALVDVYDFFPLQPFISITINPDFDMPRAKFSTDEDATMAIARLKKAFDQNDRTLVTATKNYIVFAMSKNGGVRVVRQDNGKNKMVFEETQDQIFNVAACVDKDNACETVVATGCSGTVYWFMAKDAGGDSIEDVTPHNSFAMPPIQSPGDENPGGVLKTRARKSSNHTQFFGVGRGKSIHIIFPNTITNGDFYKPETARTVDVEKYLAHRTLKIDTGKAAKDFTFSQDDTTVVSLDKAGRIKFWDIRGLVFDDAKAQSVELTEPLLTLVTTPANEKSWPTSIIFIDKLRRVVKNNALRYLLVGMKQNHTLQLWDLALRRIVQEIHLPHDKDSDAACSVVYHVATSMIVVGHPTRNSIYFIHVSLPRFSHKTLSQADFVEQVGKGTFAEPKTSAAFNTIREYTFSEGTKPETGSDKRVRGDLRSLDILQDPANTHDSSILFELYTMHSTGVTSIAIRPETLGWNSDLTDIKTLPASEAGLTSFTKLKPIEQAVAQKENLPASPSATASTSVQSTPQVKEILRKPASTSSTQVESANLQSPTPNKRADSVPKVVNAGQDAVAGGVEKTEKKKKRKGSSSSRATDASMDTMASSSKPMQSIPEGSSEAMATKNGPLDVEQLVGSIFTGFELGFDKVMDAFIQQRDTASNNQVKLLEVVSKTLTENVDAALGRIVLDQFKTVIAPVLNGTIQEVLEKSVSYHLKNILNGVVQTSVAKEVQSALSGALTKAFSSPQFMKQMSQMMSQLGLAREATQLGTNESLRTLINSVGEIQKQRTADVEKIDALLKQRERDAEVIDIMVKQREADSEKIDKLEVVVRQLGELISSMASAEEKSRQSSLEREDKLIAIIEQMQAPRRATTPSRDSPQMYSPEPSPDASGQIQQSHSEPEQSFDEEKCSTLIGLISQAMTDARRLTQMKDTAEAKKKMEFALHNWLSCGDDQMTQIIFDYCLCKEDPVFMFQLDDPIYIYITMRALASNLNTASFKHRLDWLSTSMQAARNFNYRNMNPSLTENFPEVILYVRQCLEQFFNNSGSNDFDENVVRVIADVIKSSQQLLLYIQN